MVRVFRLRSGFSFFVMCLVVVAALGAASASLLSFAAETKGPELAGVRSGSAGPAPLTHRIPPEEWVPAPAVAESSLPRVTSLGAVITLGPFTSVQVNTDALGDNIINDAANEPSIAVSPVNPDQIVIAWRQFDTIFDPNAFRQAGIGYSHDRGQNWTAFTLDPGQFRSDPVLGADAAGRFFLSSLSSATAAQVWRSLDGGVNWTIANAFGGDKQWIAVDERPAGVGAGHVYQIWNVQFSCCPPNNFTRSVNSGLSFQSPVAMPQPSMKWGTLDTGPDGTLYLAGATLDQTGHLFTKSTNATDPFVTPTFDPVRLVNLGGQTAGGGVNPAGLLGQVWIAVDNSTRPTAGNVYIAGTVANVSDTNPTNVRFIRSEDGGQSWSDPVLVNEDPESGGYHWFGTMSVAPNGRIDMVWNDTRNAPITLMTEGYYSFSIDAGRTWSTNVPLTPPWNPFVGYPNQNKIGDYYHMISDNGGASLAYAATFNGEEDVYFLRIPRDCNDNGIEDDCDIECGSAGTRCDVVGCGTFADCNDNVIPDVCEPNEDCNNNTVPDVCDIGSGSSGDCNNNLVPDECESDLDCNGNSVPDICDIATGTSKDCNGNDVPDDCDIATSTSEDANDDGVPDECQGACCSCVECTNVSPSACQAINGAFSGLGVFCGDSGSCTPAPPANDVCDQAVVLPSEPSLSEPFDNRCASLDGPASVSCPTSQPMGADLWYNYVAPCPGVVTASLCDQTSFDSMMDVYEGTSSCPCPSSSSGRLVCGDDTCGTVGGPSVVTFSVSAGACYTIRVGGWSGSKGTGALDLSYDTACTPRPLTPQADPSGYDKSRFISMSVPALPAFRNVALRVTLTSLHHVDPPYTGGPSIPFTAFEGQVRWVGPQTEYVESDANPTLFLASLLQCTPYYQDWSSLGLIHVTGSAIVPSSIYNVQAVAESCAGSESSCAEVSDALQLRTTRWGDVDALFNPPSTASQPDFADIGALVNKFKGAQGALIKARALLAGDEQGVIDLIPDLNFTHISAGVDAFKGAPYPFAIASCP